MVSIRFNAINYFAAETVSVLGYMDTERSDALSSSKGRSVLVDVIEEVSTTLNHRFTGSATPTAAKYNHSTTDFFCYFVKIYNYNIYVPNAFFVQSSIRIFFCSMKLAVFILW
jgi:hypothetical protein